MFVQYIRGSSVHWKVYHDYIGEIFWVHHGVFSIHQSNTLIHVRGYREYLAFGGVQDIERSGARQGIPWFMWGSSLINSLILYGKSWCADHLPMYLYAVPHHMNHGILPIFDLISIIVHMDPYFNKSFIFAMLMKDLLNDILFVWFWLKIRTFTFSVTTAISSQC